ERKRPTVMGTPSNALIQRKIITKAYEEAKRAYLVNSRPYESTLPIRFEYVSGARYAAGSPAAGLPTGFLVARANQVLEFFGYGRSANGQGGPGALPDDTTIVSARKTNASEDLVIEGVSLTHRSTRIVWSSSDYGAESINTTDPDVVGAFGGNG